MKAVNHTKTFPVGLKNMLHIDDVASPNVMSRIESSVSLRKYSF